MKLLVAALVLLASPLFAQSVVTNPGYIDFDSPDHYLQSATVYHVDFTQVAAIQPFTGFDVNASAVTVLDPLIVRVEINLATQAIGALVALPFGIEYTASVLVANANGQSLRSNESNPFVRAPLTPRGILNVIVGRRT